jgi:CRISPR-associated exonuclease Cas4
MLEDEPVGEMPEAEVISASDIERYCYCPLSWWLSREGVDAKGKEVEKGKKAHEKVGTEVSQLEQREAEIKRLEQIVLWFAVVATMLAVLGLTFLPSPVQDPTFFGYVLNIIAVVWLISAMFFLYQASSIDLKPERLKYEALIVIFAVIATAISMLSVSTLVFENDSIAMLIEGLALVCLIAATIFFSFTLSRSKRAARTRQAHSISDGDVEYVDGKKIKSKVLYSHMHNLSGKPDYIIKITNKYIPIEIKTGRVPRGPLFSHIMQLACYLLIIENNYGTPPHGILKYGEREHKIDYTEELRRTLLEKVEEMRDILDTAEAHRNHNRPGKCRSCSRRDKCPERLKTR